MSQDEMPVARLPVGALVISALMWVAIIRGVLSLRRRTERKQP